MIYSSDHFQLAATDLSNHLSCSHLTQLQRKVAGGEKIYKGRIRIKRRKMEFLLKDI